MRYPRCVRRLKFKGTSCYMLRFRQLMWRPISQLCLRALALTTQALSSASLTNLAHHNICTTLASSSRAVMRVRRVRLWGSSLRHSAHHLGIATRTWTRWRIKKCQQSCSLRQWTTRRLAGHWRPLKTSRRQKKRTNIAATSTIIRTTHR